MPRAEVLVTPGHEGVRAARRLTSATLHAFPQFLAADAELVVAELVTNAVLHGAAPINLRLRGRWGRVRIEVEDAVQTAPLRGWRGEGMTGRGIEVVDSLAYAWGVRFTEHGKVVWAELGRPRRSAVRRAATSAAAAAAGRDIVAANSEAHYEVRLGWVPTELLISAKTHIDNVVRELALMGSRTGDESDLSPETAQRLARVTDDFAEARREIKAQAVAAARRGDAFTDLVLTLPLSAADAGLRYLDALDEADRQARAAMLLTVAAPPSHRVFREWYVREIVAHLQAAARHEAPPRSTPFSIVLAAELDRVAGENRSVVSEPDVG